MSTHPNTFKQKMKEKMDNPLLIRNHETNEKNGSKKKTIVVDKDESCLKRKDKIEEEALQELRFTPGNDPRYIIIQDTLKINSEIDIHRAFLITVFNQISTAKSDTTMFRNVY